MSFCSQACGSWGLWCLYFIAGSNRVSLMEDPSAGHSDTLSAVLEAEQTLKSVPLALPNHQSPRTKPRQSIATLAWQRQLWRIIHNRGFLWINVVIPSHHRSRCFWKCCANFSRCLVEESAKWTCGLSVSKMIRDTLFVTKNATVLIPCRDHIVHLAVKR